MEIEQQIEQNFDQIRRCANLYGSNEYGIVHNIAISLWYDIDIHYQYCIQGVTIGLWSVQSPEVETVVLTLPICQLIVLFSSAALTGFDDARYIVPQDSHCILIWWRGALHPDSDQHSAVETWHRGKGHPGLPCGQVQRETSFTSRHHPMRQSQIHSRDLSCQEKQERGAWVTPFPSFHGTQSRIFVPNLWPSVDPLLIGHQLLNPTAGNAGNARSAFEAKHNQSQNFGRIHSSRSWDPVGTTWPSRTPVNP